MLCVCGPAHSRFFHKNVWEMLLNLLVSSCVWDDSDLMIACVINLCDLTS